IPGCAGEGSAQGPSMPAAKKSTHPSLAFTAVVGTDEARVKEAALKLSRELLPPDAGDFGADIIDGVAESAEHCAQTVTTPLDALQTLPFFGGKLVWLKNVNFMADSQVGKTIAAVDGMEAILEYVEKTNAPGVKFLLSATAIDKRRSAWRRIQKIADLHTYDK